MHSVNAHYCTTIKYWALQNVCPDRFASPLRISPKKYLNSDYILAYLPLSTGKRGFLAAFSWFVPKGKKCAHTYLPDAPGVFFLRSMTLATASASPPSEVSL